MSCTCQSVVVTSPTGDCLPTIEDACVLAKPDTLCVVCPEEESLQYDGSDGTTLANSWLDALCATSDMTLLGRVGTKLARFAGSGFIKLTAGKASVVDSLPIKFTTLWHKWWRPTTSSVPILGDPLEFPFQAIVDEYGNPHVIRGLYEVDSLTLWDASKNAFVQTSTADVADVLLDGYTIPDFVALFNTALTN